MPIEEKENSVRIRQRNPADFESKSFRTIRLRDGVQAVVGKLKGKQSLIIQSIIFDKNIFDVEKAKAWAKDHGYKFKQDVSLEGDKMEKTIFAKWTVAYMNDLPDSAFLHIFPGGKKDSDGKTVPRSLRVLPVYDAEGKLDMAHVRNAIARCPLVQDPANGNKISEDLIKSLQDKARKLLGKEKMSDEEISLEVFTFFSEQGQIEELQSLVDALEKAKTIEEIKSLIPKIKALVFPVDETKPEDEQTTPQDQTANSEIQNPDINAEIKTKLTDVQVVDAPKPDVEIVDKNKVGEQLSEALDLNDKVITALKDAENEINSLKAENVTLKNNLEVFKAEIEKTKQKEEQEKLEVFNQKVGNLAEEYCKFFEVSSDKEKEEYRQIFSKYSEEELVKTAELIKNKNFAKMSTEEEVITKPSSDLEVKESTTETQEVKQNLFKANFGLDSYGALYDSYNKQLHKKTN